jgi:hypothetical protein
VPVRVNGHPGFYARITRLLSTVEVLYWQYAPGAWAEATAPSRAAELALAESARPASVPLPVPVAPTRVSAGQYVNTLASDPADRAGGYEVAGRGAGYYVSWGRPLDGESALERPGAEHVTINGHDWTIIGGRQPAARLDGPVPVAVQPYDGTSRNRLLDVLRGLRVAGDLSDPGSWFAAAEVLG